MADRDAEVRDVALELMLATLNDYKSHRKSLSSSERQTLLAELAAFRSSVQATAPTQTYRLFSPEAIADGIPAGELGRLQAQSTH